MTPLLIVGDAPNRPTGLARIARDITTHIQRDPSILVRVAQLAWGYDGSPWPWVVYPVMDSDNWGEGDIVRTLQWHRAGRDKIVVFTIWDPSRCYPIASEVSKLREQGYPVELWGYFAIDGADYNGGFGGPAAEALRQYDRILAYGRYGQAVLEKVAGRKVQWLPHGYYPEAFNLDHMGEVGVPAADWLPPTGIMVGCVAGNQPRKDLGLLFEAVAAAKGMTDEPVHLWLHTDYEIKHWSVPQLHEIYNVDLVVSTELGDKELAARYGMCDVTVAPGLGEGFGYPIVESLACGTPVVHGRHAGGPELMPDDSWCVSPMCSRADGIYAIQRPVYNAGGFATALLRAAEWKRSEVWTRRYCNGAVSHLRWKNLWPLWAGWVRRGL